MANKTEGVLKKYTCDYPDANDGVCGEEWKQIVGKSEGSPQRGAFSFGKGTPASDQAVCPRCGNKQRTWEDGEEIAQAGGGVL